MRRFTGAKDLQDIVGCADAAGNTALHAHEPCVRAAALVDRPIRVALGRSDGAPYELGVTTTSSITGPAQPGLVPMNVIVVVVPASAVKIRVSWSNGWFPAGDALAFGVKLKLCDVVPAVTMAVLGSLAGLIAPD